MNYDPTDYDSDCDSDWMDSQIDWDDIDEDDDRDLDTLYGEQL